MKKFTVILLSFIVCFTFFGCSADIPSDAASTSELKTEITSVTTTISESTVTLPDNTKNESNTEKSESKSTTEKTTLKSTSATTKSTNKSTSATSKNTSSTAKANADTTKKVTTKATTTKKTTTTTKSASTSATEKSTTKKQITTSSTITCTVTVECKNILGNMDNLKAGHEAYVPSDGYIINGYSVTLPNGSSAYDAVKTACDRQGVSMNVSNSSFGKYIAGFNNIDEKDCGSQSGWIYNINGTYLSKSCDRYALSNGDNVVFSYTCSYK